MGFWIEWRPPSEKESGVRFRTVMRWVVLSGDWELIGGRLGDS